MLSKQKIVQLLKEIPTWVWVTLFFYTSFLFVYFTKISSLKNFLLSIENIVLSIILTFLYSYFLSLINIFPRALRFLINFSFILVFSILLLFYYHSGCPLEFQLLVDYQSEIFTEEVEKMLLANLGLNTKIFLGVVLILIPALELKWRILSSVNFVTNRVIKIVITFIIIISLYFIPIKSFDPISQFNYSFISYLRVQSVYPLDEEVIPYQYINNSKRNLEIINSDKDMPNVFFLVVESLKNNVIGLKNGDREITPFLNTMKNKCVYVENFYGNCVVTARGQFSLLFSVLPSYNEKVFEKGENIKFKSLAEILNEEGYETIFFQGFNNINFDNTYRFLTKNGFKYCKTAKPINFLEEVPYGGVHDFALYDRFFTFVDSLEKRERGSKYFGVLATISSHRPYLVNSSIVNLPYPNAKNVREQYLNSIRLADYSVEVFFEKLKLRRYLKNSIVIIVGDHSIPMGEHGNYLNANGAYEENFKTPLFIYWNKLIPRLIDDVAWSQIDVAPTILDLLNLSVKNHFFGQSIFSGNKNTVYLIQPYDGLIFSIIDYPYKYVNKVMDGVDFLYNLNDDPMEVNNLIELEQYDNLINDFRLKNKVFGINQYLIDHDLIWDE